MEWTWSPRSGSRRCLVCTGAGRQLGCRNMNGDPDTPVGAGVFGAIQGRGWRWVTAPRYSGGLPPGIHFTSADSRVLIDLLRFGTTIRRSGSSGPATRIPITHLPATHNRTSH